MALINCPVCGKSVSDKGKDCIHCGSLLSVSNSQSSLNDEVVCPECGAYMPKDNERCDVCGCPVTAEVADKDKKKSKKDNTKNGKVNKGNTLSLVFSVVSFAISEVAKNKKENTKVKKLNSKKKIFNACSIALFVLSELAIIVGTVDLCYILWMVARYGFIRLYEINLLMLIPLGCRLVFVILNKVFEKKAQRAERELEKLISEEAKLNDIAEVESDSDVENEVYVEDDVDVIE